MFLKKAFSMIDIWAIMEHYYNTQYYCFCGTCIYCRNKKKKYQNYNLEQNPLKEMVDHLFVFSIFFPNFWEKFIYKFQLLNFIPKSLVDEYKLNTCTFYIYWVSKIVAVGTSWCFSTILKSPD